MYRLFMKSYAAHIFSFLLAACLLCGQAKGRNLVVVTTTTMITDLVRDVGGEDVQILSLMGVGTDPHLYKPTAHDIKKIRLADVIFYNGLHLEGRMEEVLHSMQKRNPSVKALGANLPEHALLRQDKEHQQPDPHIWFDVQLWSSCVDIVATTLAEQDPLHAATFIARGEKLKQKYAKLHEWVQTSLNQIPPEQRILITSHDAYSYFGRAYDVEVKGVQGISTVIEAGLSDITAMVDFIKKYKVKSIFIESSVSPSVIERISRDAGVQVGGELYSDSLGSPKESFVDPLTGTAYPLDTYEGVVRYNVHTIVEGLK